jgi:hypothetical protein
MLLLLPGFSFVNGPLDFTAQLPPEHNAFLRDYLTVLRGIGGRLEPRQFSGPQTSTGELLRTL